MADRLILLVEGKDEKIVLEKLARVRPFFPGFREQDELGQEIEDEAKIKIDVADGYEKLRDQSLPVILAAGACERLGVIADADTDIVSRWNSLKNVLIKTKYPISRRQRHDQNGTIIPSTDLLPKLGVWIMPNNRDVGMMENYLIGMVPRDDPLMIQAEKCVDEVPESESRFNKSHRAKAVIHTWLAWQKKPGTPLGSAISKKYIRPDNEDVSSFLNWLTLLFGDGSGVP